MGVKILADSACDLPLEFYQENNVALIPLKVLIDENEYEAFEKHFISPFLNCAYTVNAT